MRSPRLALAATSALAVTLAAGSALALRVAPAHRSPPPVVTGSADPREAVTRTTVDMGALPSGSLPTPLAILPKTRGPLAEEIVPNPARPLSAVDAEKLKRTGGSLQVTVATPHAFDIEVGANASGLRFASTEVWISCGPHAPSVPIRWSVFKPTDKGGTLTVNEGFTEPKSCTVTRERSTDLPFARVLETKGARVPVFAMGTPTGIMVVMPPTQVVSADAGGQAIHVHRSVLTRVALPLTRGGSASFAAGVDVFRLPTYVERLGLPKLQAAPQKMTVQLEASQGVDEEKPTVLLRVASADRVGL